MAKRFIADVWGGLERGHILIWTFDGDSEKTSRWFADASAAGAYVESIKNRRVNVYMGVGVSPQDYGAARRCTKENITGIAGLWADIDIADGVHKKPNLPQTVDDALALVAAVPMAASYVIHSGHGLQAWWLFREPWMFDSDEERSEAETLARRFNGYLQKEAAKKGWTVDAVWNLDRVMRVPSTWNVKSEHVKSRALARTTDRYNPQDFDDFLPEDTGGGAVANGNGNGAAVDYVIDAKGNPPFDKFLAACEIEPKFKASWDKQRKDFQDQSASTYDLSLARFGYMFGWTDQEVADLIVAFRRRHGEDLKLRRDYYDRTLKRAKLRIEEQEAIEEIEAHVDSHAPEDAVVVDPNRKEAIMQSLSALFGVQIVQIARYVAESPLYRIKTAQGSITLGEVDNLITQNALRSKIAAATGRYLPRYKAERWDKIAQALLDCCVDVEIGDDATESGEVRGWLSQYLEHKPPYPNDEKMEALATGFPFAANDGADVVISGTDFRQWLRVTQQERMTPKKMGVMLRMIGGESTTMRVEIDGTNTSRSVWMMRGWYTKGGRC